MMKSLLSIFTWMTGVIRSEENKDEINFYYEEQEGLEDRTFSFFDYGPQQLFLHYLHVLHGYKNN